MRHQVHLHVVIVDTYSAGKFHRAIETKLSGVDQQTLARLRDKLT